MDVDDSLQAGPDVPPRASAAIRVLAGIGGILVLVAAAVVTLGMALVAPVGMAIGAGLASLRRRPLTRYASWGWATGSVVVTIVASGTLLVASLPSDSVRKIEHSMDSASAVTRPAPPPAWIAKISPEASTAQSQALSEQMMRSRTARRWMSIVGIVFGAGLWGGFAGSLGWCGGMLLVYAGRGRWMTTRYGVTVK